MASVVVQSGDMSGKANHDVDVFISEFPEHTLVVFIGSGESLVVVVAC